MVNAGVEIQRGEIWWADLPYPRGSEPGFTRPVLVIQADSFNRSRIQTVIVAVITSNLNRESGPGNVRLSARASRLPKDSVVNVSQLLTVDRAFLTQHLSTVSGGIQASIDAGLRLVLDL